MAVGRWVPITLGLCLFCIYAWLASGYSYWFDSGEFVAASAHLGIAHPPGHPLAVLLGALASFLPFGPLAYRISLASSFFAALGASVFWVLLYRTLLALPHAGDRERPLWFAALSAVIGALLLGLCNGYLLQATRTEVYALHGCLAILFLERVQKSLSSDRGWPALAQASLILGLALANHHFLALLLAPLILLCMLRQPRELSFGRIFCVAGAGLPGLLVYVYLPLRALSGSPHALGSPSNWKNFFWVVSAQTFQKNAGEGVPGPFLERLFDTLMALSDSLTPVALLLAFLGLYILLRVQLWQGLLWVFVAVIHILARAYLGFVRHNPDALGYLIPAIASLVLATIVLCTLALERIVLFGFQEKISRAKYQVGIRLIFVGAFLFAGLFLWRTLRSPQVFFSSRATDSYGDFAYRMLPPRTILILHQPQSLFALWGIEAEEQLRPDIQVVPMPFLHYPEMIPKLIDEESALKNWLSGGPVAIESKYASFLTMKKPVRLELDLRVPFRDFPNWVSAGLLFAPSAAPTDEGIHGFPYLGNKALLYAERRITKEPQTRSLQESKNHMLWDLYMHALHSGSIGDTKRALDYARRAKRYAPGDKAIHALENTLKENGFSAGDLDPSSHF